MRALAHVSFAALAPSHVHPRPRQDARSIRRGGLAGRTPAAGKTTRVEPLEPRTFLSAGDPPPTFSAPITLPLGGGFGTGVGDFTGDGLPDLVVDNSDAGTLDVRPGDGTGRFGAPRSSPAGQTSGFLTVGDFNGDGRLDVAQTEPGEAVLLRLGDGRGGFASARSFPAGGRTPVHPVAADFNNDGRLDLATSGWFNDDMRVHLGDGAGGLSEPAVYPAGSNTLGLLTADFNADRNADLAVSNFSDNTVSVFLGNGAGGFSRADFPAGDAPNNLRAGDFDGDGRLDLAVGTWGFLGGQEESVTLLRGDGAGRFAAPNLVAGPGLAGFTAADFDGDGVTDLAVRHAGGRSFAVIRTDAAGRFVDAGSISAGDSPAAIISADYTGDGRPDVVLGNGASGSLTVLRNTTSSSDTLVVDGTSGNDQITVDLAPGGASASVTVNGATTTRPLAGITRIVISALAGNDKVKVAGNIRLPATLDGGAGHDMLIGGAGRDTLLGGAGSDTLDGRGGADLFRGGGGTDTADYTARRNSVSVGIGTAADDGERGEGDNVFNDVENVWGGRGNDTLRGSSANNRLVGGDGDDVVVGRGGRDTLLGAAGNDTLAARDGDSIPDTLDGGPGTDAAQADRRDVLLSIETAPAGAVTYVAQARSIGAGLREEYHVYPPGSDQFEKVTLDAGDGRSAPDFGEFQASVRAQVAPPPGFVSGVASGSQRSRLTDAGVFVSGEFDGRTGSDLGGYGVQSIVDVTFDIDRPRSYRLAYAVEVDTSANPRLRTSLTPVAGPVVFEEVPEMNSSPITGSLGGTLAPGRYRFEMDYQVGGDVGTTGTYLVELALTP